MGSIYGSVPKFNDVTDTLTVTAAAGNGADKLDNVSAIDIGTGPTDRNAQCVAVKSLYINYEIFLASHTDTAATAATIASKIPDINWQLLVILDRQPNKAALTAALIWESPTTFLSPLNLDNRKRIKILKKYKGKMNLAAHSNAAGYSTGVTTALFWRAFASTQRKCYMKFKKPMQIEYDTGATTGVIGDIVDNAISIWLMTDRAAADALLSCSLYARTRFVSC